MPRCTDEEYNSDVPEIICLCDFRDCQLDVAEMFTEAGAAIVSDPTLSVSEKVELLEQAEAQASSLYADCRAEYARCKGQEPRPPRKVFTKPQKEAIRTASRELRAMGWIGGAVGVAMFIVPQFRAARAIGGVLAMTGLTFNIVSSNLNDLRDDPVDDNFQNVSQPMQVELPRVEADGDVLGPVQAELLNKVLNNQSAGVSLAIATSTAVNRLQGAEVAGDSAASDRQLAAARGFALQWADILMNAYAVRAQAAASLSAFDSILTVSREQALQAQAQLAATGLPTELTQIIALFGVGEQERDRLISVATATAALDISRMTGGVIGPLVDPPLQSAELELMAVLREFGLE